MVADGSEPLGKEQHTRPLPILLLAAGLTLVGCDGNPPTGEPPTTGTLVVSTSTRGEDPDQDGYLLTVDDADSLNLDPSGRAEIDVVPGRHSLILHGVADQCWVDPGSALEMDVLGGSSTPVTFRINCSATRAHVTVRTTGLTPDPDGYLLTVDDADSLGLAPTAAAAVDLSPGRHTLRLLDVSDRCSVAPGTTIEVNLLPGITTPVVFEVTCSTGARVTVRTTGLDIDPDGYRVEVAGTDREHIQADGEVLTGLEPGSWTITLTGLTSNCTIDGPGSRTVTIAAAEVAPIEFAVVCTATSGVIGVRVTGSDTGVYFQVAVDGTTRFSLLLYQGSRIRYLDGVPAGAHVVSLTGCSVETEPRTVTVSAGSLIRDTVEVTFLVTCPSGTIRITAPTTGSVPQGGYYTVILCTDLYYCDSWTAIGRIAPNDTLLLEVPASTYRANLYFPTRCRVTAQNPSDPFQFVGGRLDLEFRVECS